jgi:hypothetical protein
MATILTSSIDCFSAFLVARVSMVFLRTVALGAKHVYSTVMKSSDALELKRQDVDIKSFLSVSFQAKFGDKVNRGDEFFQAPADDGEDDKTITLVVTDTPQDACPASCPPKPKTLGEKFGGTFGVETVNEVNVGGRPLVDGDLTGWAESARERTFEAMIICPTS